MSSKQANSTQKSTLVLRRVAIRQSFRPSHAPEGVAEFIDSTEYPHKQLLKQTMSGLFDSQIPSQRPEWWIVYKNQEIAGLALVSYSELNGEMGIHVGIEHLLVAQGNRNEGVGTKIIHGLKALVRKEGVAGINLESERELISYYRKFGFVERSYQGFGQDQFVKLIWRRP